jgi:hypothetical protein
MGTKLENFIKIHIMHYNMKYRQKDTKGFMY